MTPEPRQKAPAAKTESPRNPRSGERKSGSRRGQGDGPDRDVVGFGEHVPGFMQTQG